MFDYFHKPLLFLYVASAPFLAALRFCTARLAVQAFMSAVLLQPSLTARRIVSLLAAVYIAAISFIVFNSPLNMCKALIVPFTFNRLIVV